MCPSADLLTAIGAAATGAATGVGVAAAGGAGGERVFRVGIEARKRQVDVPAAAEHRER